MSMPMREWAISVISRATSGAPRLQAPPNLALASMAETG
jgi:hypothetical protein